MTPWGGGWGSSKGGGGGTSLSQEVADLRKLVIEAYADPMQMKGKGKGKGKEKGKGKSSGKEKGKGGKGKGNAESASQWWNCPIEECKMKLNAGIEFCNHPGRDSCKLCLGPKAAASSVVEQKYAKAQEEVRAKVKADAAKAAATDEGWTPALSKTAKKKIRNAERKKEHLAKEAAEKEEQEETESMEEEEEPLPTEEDIAKAMKTLYTPGPLKEGWAAADVVRDGAAADASDSLGALKKEQASCTQIITMMAGGAAIAGVDVAATKLRLTALEKEITKATKEVPTIDVSVAQLRLKKAVYMDDRVEKLKFVEKGALQSKENFQEARAMFLRMVEHWNDRLTEMEEQEVTRQECFDSRNQEHEGRNVKVLAEYDKQILEAVKVAEDKAKDNAKPAQGAPAPAPQLVTPSPAEVAAAEATALEEEKKKKAAAATAAAAAVELQAAREAFKQLEREAVFVKEDLPDLSTCAEMKDGAAEALGDMYLWARASALGDLHVPFTFAEMGATTKVAADLVGKTVWEAFFVGSKTPISNASVCPMMLRQVMFLQLMTYDAALKAKKHATKHAEVAETLEKAQFRVKTMKALVRASPYA